jgi:hypothetical protein
MGTRILIRGSRASADVVSVAIAINPVDKSLIVVIELAF